MNQNGNLCQTSGLTESSSSIRKAVTRKLGQRLVTLNYRQL